MLALKLASSNSASTIHTARASASQRRGTRAALCTSRFSITAVGACCTFIRSLPVYSLRLSVEARRLQPLLYYHGYPSPIVTKIMTKFLTWMSLSGICEAQVNLLHTRLPHSLFQQVAHLARRVSQPVRQPARRDCCGGRRARLALKRRFCGAQSGRCPAWGNDGDASLSAANDPDADVLGLADQALAHLEVALPLEKWLSVISWAKQCGRMKQEPSSPTCSTFEEKSLHSCLPLYYLTFPVSVWSR